MANELIQYKGELYGTGLMLPENRVSGYKLFMDAKPMLTREQVNKIISDPTRKSGRKRFGPDWIGNQRHLGACFPPGTLIRMGDGSQKPIEEVRLLDEVLTAEGNVRRVIRTMVRPHVDNVYRVCIWGHRHLRCTGEHPILTKRGYVAAESLTKDDWVAIPKYAPRRVSVIEPYKYIKQPVGVKKQKCMTQAVGSVTQQIPGKSAVTIVRSALPDLVELDYEFGYLIGVFLAEGCLNNSKIDFTFHVKESDTLAQKVVDTWASRFGVTANKVIRSNKCEVKVYGSLWCKFFAEMCATGSGRKRLHPDLASAPLECLRGIIEGWQAGDGLGDKDRRGGVTVSHSLAMNMYDIATVLGYQPTVETLQVKINPKHNIKSRQLRYVVAWPTYEKPDPVHSKREQDDKYVWRKIAKLETEEYAGNVFNLEVEGDHSYVAESIGVHNCNGFACAYAAARARVRRGLKRKVLSGFALYSAINGGVDRGSQLKDGMDWMQRHGTPEAYAGEQPEFRWGRIPQSQKDTMADNVMLECYAMETELELAVASALGFDCVVAVHASNRWSTLDSDGISLESNGVGNHAVLVDDVILSSTGEWLFDMANSWNTTWGQQGRAYQTWRRHFQQTIRYHQFFAIRSTVDGK